METAMTIYWTPAELLFLCAVAVVIAFLVAGEMLEALRVRQPARALRRGSSAAAQPRDERLLR
jgi:hypothetical protein